MLQRQQDPQRVAALEAENAELKRQVSVVQDAAFEDQRKLVTSGQEQGEHKLQKALDAAQKRLGCVKKPVSSVKFPSHFADEGRIPESEWA